MRLDAGSGELGEGLVLTRLAQRDDEQLRVAWSVHRELPSVQIARWFYAGDGEWVPLVSQVSLKLYELLPVRAMLRRAHARRRPGTPGALFEQRWLGRGRGRRCAAVHWSETGVTLSLGAQSVAIDRASLCHVFEALDVGIALGREIPDSALAKIEAGWCDPEYAARVVALAAEKRGPARIEACTVRVAREDQEWKMRQREGNPPNEPPLNEPPLDPRPNGRAAVPASRPVQTDLFGEAPPAPKPKKQAGPGGRIAAAFYRALDEAGLPHVVPVWSRDVAMAKRLIERVKGEATAEELIPLAVDDPWLRSRAQIDFGCFLRIADTLYRKWGELSAEREAAARAKREEQARNERVWDGYRTRYGRRHPDDTRS